MEFPHVVLDDLTEDHYNRWQTQFEQFERTRHEGLWVRTQDPRNADVSGWSGPDDMRRRLVHFLYRYNMVENDGRYQLILEAPYLWVHLLFPENELNHYIQDLTEALEMGNWMMQEEGMYLREDLRLQFKILESHPEDQLKGREFPDKYRILEVTLDSPDTNVTKDEKRRPWEVLALGIREKDQREYPTIVTNLSQIDMGKHFPAQFELGCGPSIEAGVPALHSLHEVYSVRDLDSNAFLFGHQKDKLLVEIAKDPESFFERATLMYRSALHAELTPFYHLLTRLQNRKLLVGPVITNNFDGLISRAGLSETFIGDYDFYHPPTIEFHPDAKSLIVVGAHADRRRILSQARKEGLQVIYVNPEGYHHHDGSFTSYPLEGPKTCDIVIRMTANQFAQQLENYSN